MTNVRQQLATLALLTAALTLPALATIARAQARTPSPGAKLIAASVVFHTHDGAKPSGALVAVTLRRGPLRVAQLHGLRGDFQANSSSGPFALEVLRPIPVSRLQGLAATISFVPTRPITWKFDYDIHLTFSDGTGMVRHVHGVVLTQDSRRDTHTLGPAA